MPRGFGGTRAAMSEIRLNGDGASTLYRLLAGKIPQAPCGGQGTCGKCRVRIIGQANRPSAADARHLSASETAAGWRLACTYVPEGPCLVDPDDSPAGTADGYRIVSAYDVPLFTPNPIHSASSADAATGLGIAVDIGTTTVALQLVDRASGRVLAGDSALNSQKRYGADVVSRIRASMDGLGPELRSAIRADINAAIGRMLEQTSLAPADVTLITIAANTTMIHLLLGLSCRTLGVSPFTPAATVFPEYAFGRVFGDEDDAAATGDTAAIADIPVTSSVVPPDCPVRIVPCLSAFIGGDVLSGLAALELAPLSSAGPELFLDLGTNAEMVLVRDGSFWCASAAAGPAFEGGSISCGTGSVKGAVSSVYMDDNRFGFALIGESAGFTGTTRVSEAARPVLTPVGLCGSGLLDFIACALAAGLILKDGALSPVCAESGILLDSAGRIRLTAKDVREVQVAKAAIRAALAVLLRSAGIGGHEVVRVHLAGGFGSYLKEASALALGLLPPEFSGKIHSAGNASLAGAARFLTDVSMQDRFDGIMAHANTVQLADNPAFNSLFIAFMEFP